MSYVNLKQNEGVNTLYENVNINLILGVNSDVLMDMRLGLTRDGFRLDNQQLKLVQDKCFIKSILERTVFDIIKIKNKINSVFGGPIVNSLDVNDAVKMLINVSFPEHQNPSLFAIQYDNKYLFNNKQSHVVYSYSNYSNNMLSFSIERTDIESGVIKNSNIEIDLAAFDKTAPFSKFVVRNIKPRTYRLFSDGLVFIGRKDNITNGTTSTFILIYSYCYGLFWVPDDITYIGEIDFSTWESEIGIQICIYYYVSTKINGFYQGSDRIVIYNMETSQLITNINLSSREVVGGSLSSFITNFLGKWIILTRHDYKTCILDVSWLNLKTHQIEDTSKIVLQLSGIVDFKLFVEQSGDIGILIRKLVARTNNFGVDYDYFYYR